MVKICHESDVAFDGQQVALQPLLYFFFFLQILLYKRYKKMHHGMRNLTVFLFKNINVHLITKEKKTKHLNWYLVTSKLHFSIVIQSQVWREAAVCTWADWSSDRHLLLCARALNGGVICQFRRVVLQAVHWGGEKCVQMLESTAVPRKRAWNAPELRKTHSESRTSRKRV